MGKVKRINFKTRKFKANGVWYHIDDVVSVARFREYEKLIPQITFGVSFDQMFSTLRTIYDASTQGESTLSALHTCATLSYNQMRSVADVGEEKTAPILLFCALFCNAVKEDAAKYDEKVINEKIENWQKEGIAIQDFFTLALGSIQGFKSVYGELLSLINEKEKKTTGEDLK